MRVIRWIKKHYFQLQVTLLVIFKSTVLFDKINQLDWYKNTLRQWVDDQDFPTNSNILEVGCATGRLTAYMAKSKLIPTGVDYSSNMVKLAQHKHSNIDFLTANVLELPFNTAFFNGVIAASLINIISDKKTAINELSRVCKKGGRLTIFVPSAKFNDKNLHSLQASLDNSGFSNAAMEAWHKLAPKMKVSDISLLFEHAGLTEITTKSYLQGMVIAISAIKPFNREKESVPFK